MRLLRFFLALSVLAIAGGCATGYQSDGVSGGYTDQKLDDATYVVKFDGNGYASSDRVWNFWIYRCAELTREKGYEHFTLAAVPDKTGRFGMPDGSRLAAADGRNASANDWRIVKTGGYTYLPGYTVTTWHSKAIVRMFNDNPPEGARTGFLAQSIIDQLKPYVASDGKNPAPLRNDLLQKATVVVNFMPLRGI